MRRPWLLPLVPLYAAGLAWKSRGFARRTDRARRLHFPVISVGSLSAGGAGKTPFLIALGDALRRAGFAIDVLSRGYGRASTGTLRVRAEGTSSEFGDEPMLLAQRLACAVYVSRERFDAGQMAETDRRMNRTHGPPLLHLLDDGFQHRQLARTVDLVLFTAEDARDMLLPAGNLREPLRALRRAGVLVIRAEEAKEVEPVLARCFARSPQPPVWRIERHVAVVEGTPSQRPLAFCGIARPESFRDGLSGMGVQPAEFLPLRDHQRYDDALLARLILRAGAAGADGFITTAKDAVKLTRAMRLALARVGPLAVTDVRVRLLDEQQCIETLVRMLHACGERSISPSS